jgi:hypothetical protein
MSALWIDYDCKKKYPVSPSRKVVVYNVDAKLGPSIGNIKTQQCMTHMNPGQFSTNLCNRFISSTATLHGKKNFRKFLLYNKRGTRLFKK